MKTNIRSNPGPLSRALSTSILTFAATAALLIIPATVQAATFYVSSQPNGGGIGYIDKVDSIGTVSLFATLPSGSNPYGVAFDTSGNLYVADQSTDQISKITSGGAVSLFATLPAGSFPSAVAFGVGGILYAADSHTAQISKITGAGVVSTFATLPGGSFPFGLAFDSSGVLYASDASTDQITKFTAGGVASVFATLPDSPAGILGLAFDSSGNLYAANNGNNGSSDQVDRISPNGLTTSTFATGVTLPRFIAFVPEPGSAALALLGGLSLLARRRRSAA